MHTAISNYNLLYVVQNKPKPSTFLTVHPPKYSILNKNTYQNNQLRTTKTCDLNCVIRTMHIHMKMCIKEIHWEKSIYNINTQNVVFFFYLLCTCIAARRKVKQV